MGTERHRALTPGILRVSGGWHLRLILEWDQSQHATDPDQAGLRMESIAFAVTWMRLKARSAFRCAFELSDFD